MCKCNYVNCEREATKKVILAEIEITEGEGCGTGFFCEEHAYEIVECGADTIEDI